MPANFDAGVDVDETSKGVWYYQSDESDRDWQPPEISARSREP
jgi:hypothetical protein